MTGDKVTNYSHVVTGYDGYDVVWPRDHVDRGNPREVTESVGHIASFSYRGFNQKRGFCCQYFLF